MLISSCGDNAHRSQSITGGGGTVPEPNLREPSAWALHHFGANADRLRRLVPQAMAATVGRALDAHQASKMTTDHAFGNARWVLQYEELVTHLQHLPDTHVLRAPHTFFQVIVVNDHLLLPWCYADHRCPVDDRRQIRPPAALTMKLLSRFGPRPHWRQPHLPLTDPEQWDDPAAVARVESGLDELDPPPAVVLVGYACNSTEGLLDVMWGTAAPAEDGLLEWHHREALPIPEARIPQARIPQPRIPRQRDG